MTPVQDRRSPVVSRTAALWLLATAAAALACSSPSGPIRADAGSHSDGGPDAGPAAGNDGGTGGPDAGSGPVVLVLSATPPIGPTIGGTVVVLLGQGFVNGFALQGGPQASMATSVTVGVNEASPAELSVIDDTTIQFTIPPGTVGPADITVTNPSGTGTCSGCFTYYQTVQLTAITSPVPPQGSTLGGTPFTLTGSGFASGQLVLIGDAQATNIVVSADGTSLTGITPAGKAGASDVAVISADASAFLRLAWVYVAPMTVSGVSPNGSPLAGGGTATVSGSGFTVDSQVSLGGTAAQTTWVSDTQLTITVPPATSAGAVDVQVAGSRSHADLPNGFAYFDSSQNFQLFAVSPQQGPVSGGTCAAGTGCVHLVGSGFPSDGSMQVALGVNLASVQVKSSNTADVDVPAASAPGVVDVIARTPSGSATLPMSFAYVNPLSITSISPASAPVASAAGQSATISGTGFSSSCQVSIGAAPATVQSAASDGSSLVVTLPAGSTGPADVVVSCGAPGSLSYQQAILPGGFTYTAPLQVLQVSPDSGAIAGNTAVNVYGNGFGLGMHVFFGSGQATQVQILSPYQAVVRTPPGNVGFVNVKVQLDTESAVLPAGFGYYDPKNSTGGASGGPMQGILNVTLLNDTIGYYGDPVPNATVSVNNDALVGTSDQNGQVTFSDPTLLKPVSITATASGFETTTVAQVDARDVTIYMTMTGPGGGPPSPQPSQQPATFKGTICGFKLPPDVAANASLHPQAQIFFTYPYVYAAPPFGLPETPVIVTQDCGEWIMQTGAFGATAIYAVFGTVDPTGNFTPYLMTVASGLNAVPGQTENVPLILNMHLDLSVPITVQISEPPPPRPAVVNEIFSYLDLGGQGAVPLGQAISQSNSFVFANHPEVSGQSLIFLNLSYVPDNPNALSLYYRRQQGDLAAGVTVGPMLPFTTLTTPQDSGTFTGSLGWMFGAGPQPDLQQVSVSAPDGTPLWQVVLPGTDQGVSMPPSALSALPPSTPATAGALYTWTLVTAASPRFEYDYFSYDQLYINAWTSFTQNQGTFVLP
jgi:hypothetical protein